MLRCCCTMYVGVWGPLHPSDSPAAFACPYNLSVQAKGSLQLNTSISVMDFPSTFPITVIRPRWSEFPLCVYIKVSRSVDSLCVIIVTLVSMFCIVKRGPGSPGCQ